MDSTTELYMKNLKDILDCVWLARPFWHSIGIALDIDDSTLEVIRQDHNHNTDDCFKAVIRMWLKDSKSKPCWKVLANAFSSPLVGVRVEEKSKIIFTNKYCCVVIALTVMLIIILMIIKIK